MGYYAKLLLVCRLRLCNPLIVFEVDSCIVLKSWTFHCKTLSLIVAPKKIVKMANSLFTKQLEENCCKTLLF